MAEFSLTFPDGNKISVSGSDEFVQRHIAYVSATGAEAIRQEVEKRVAAGEDRETVERETREAVDAELNRVRVEVGLPPEPVTA